MINKISDACRLRAAPCVYREVQVLKKAAVAAFVNRGRGTRLLAREFTEHTETERFLRRCARVRF